MTPPLPTRIGRFEIVDRLGQGGMGVVYLATDPSLRRTVAIKVLPGGDEELRERFMREARSAASLRHNNVVTIYEFGEYDDQPFIAMEFLDGESMHEVIQRKAGVALDKRLLWMIELCAGLSHAHRSGVIHRDIKPGNLMITTEGSLKILDFGLARLTSGNHTGLTRAGAIMGTPHYMSPEQITGEQVDLRSDIFSVGLVLYELLSYAKAFAGDSAPVVLHNILHKEPAPIRSLVSDIDSDLEAIVNRAIDKDREKRYQDLATFGSDLSRVRTRLLRGGDEMTQRRPAPNAGSLEPTLVRPYPKLNEIAQRRASQIASHIHSAMKQFDAGNYEAAIAECENALLLNPQEGSALELLDQVHRAAEDANVNRWLEEARALISGGELTAAEALIDQTLKLRADSTGAQELQKQVREKRREREREAERQRAVQSAIMRAKGHLDDGAFEAAVRCASEALGYDSSNAEARALKDRAATAIADRDRLKAQRNAAAAAIEESRVMMASGDATAALTILKAFEPRELVAGALVDLEKDARDVRAAKEAKAAEAAREAKRVRLETAPLPIARTPIVAPKTITPQSIAPEPIARESIEATMQVPASVVGQSSKKEPPKAIEPVERGLPVPMLAAAAVVAILAGSAGWYYFNQDTPDPLPPGPVASDPIGVDAASVIAGARQQLSNRDERGALATLAKLPAGNRDAEQLAETIRGGAAARTVSARQAADAAKKSGVDAYAQGVARQNEAAALGTAFATSDRVVALLDQATSLFAGALKVESSNTGAGGQPQGTNGGVATNGGGAAVDPGAPAISEEQRREGARLVAEGQRQLNDGDYDAAIEAYEAALKIEPKNPRATNGLNAVRKAQAAEAAALAGLKKKG